MSCKRATLFALLLSLTAHPTHAQRVVHETFAQWTKARQLTLTPNARWCAAADAVGCELSDNADALLLPDSGILTLNLTGPIQRYAQTGKFVGTLSRRGRGPGEYRYITAPSLTTSGLVAWYDQTQHRVTTIALDGTPGPAKQLMPPVTIAAVGVVNGALVVFDVPAASKLGDTVVGVFHTVPDSGAPRTIARVRTRSNGGNGGPGLMMPAPFSSQMMSSIGWSGDVAYSSGARYSVEVFPSVGTTWRIDVDVPSRAVTRADYDAMVAEKLAESKVKSVAQLQPMVRDAIARAAKTMPPLSNVKVLRDGTVWIASTPVIGEKSVRWDVFDRSGVRVGRTSLARDAHVADGERSWVLIIERGADDVPVVVRYAVSK